MLFTSNVFLFTFLPAVLIVYYIAPRPLKNPVLLCGSLVFYGWGEPEHILLLVGFILFYYCMGTLAERSRESKRATGMIMAFTAVLSFGVFVFFKWKTLPFGMSFYVLRAWSYMADVCRGKAKAQKNPIGLGLYIAMFSQMAAGPIVLYREVQGQIAERKESWGRFGEGAMLFVKGLAKYVLLSAAAFYTFEAVTALKPSQVSALSAWLGCFAYAFYIYFALSGYSDMSIGLGKMFGFEIRKNFAYPYAARSVTDFWNRWYISISRWFQEYVYLPRAGRAVNVPAMLFVWLLIGLWHGASWNMAVWGIYFGLLLTIERTLSGNPAGELPLLGRIYALAMVLIGWVFFFTPSVGDAIEYVGLMFGVGGHGFADRQGLYFLRTGAGMWALLVFCATPLLHGAYERIIYGGKRARVGLNCAVYGTIFLLCIAYLAAGDYQSFPYFTF